MTKFINKDPANPQAKWLEWHMQAYIVQEARRMGYFMEGDQNAAKRNPASAAKAKACGMLSGTPDMRFYLPRGRLLLIELKRDKMKLLETQETWHCIARSLGFEVYTVHAKAPLEAWEKVLTILRG